MTDTPLEKQTFSIYGLRFTTRQTDRHIKLQYYEIESNHCSTTTVIFPMENFTTQIIWRAKQEEN